MWNDEINHLLFVAFSQNELDARSVDIHDTSTASCTEVPLWRWQLAQRCNSPPLCSVHCSTLYISSCAMIRVIPPSVTVNFVFIVIFCVNTLGAVAGSPRGDIIQQGDTLWWKSNIFLRLNLQRKLDTRSVGRRRGGGSGDDDYKRSSLLTTNERRWHTWHDH